MGSPPRAPQVGSSFQSRARQGSQTVPGGPSKQDEFRAQGGGQRGGDSPEEGPGDVQRVSESSHDQERPPSKQQARNAGVHESELWFPQGIGSSGVAGSYGNFIPNL